MKFKHPSGETGAIQFELEHLRNRKRALDELISCLERYSISQTPLRKRPRALEHAARPNGMRSGMA